MHEVGSAFVGVVRRDRVFSQGIIYKEERMTRSRVFRAFRDPLGKRAAATDGKSRGNSKTDV